jgi:hypothetical protein
MINPFIYVRIISGSLLFLLSYALFPLAVKAFIDLFQSPTLKNTIRAGLWLVLICPAEHFLLIAVGIFCLFYIFQLFRGKEKIRLTVVFIGTLAVFSIINAYWIYAIIFGKAVVVESMSQIAASDLQIFATATDANVFLNVATLYGFWRGGYYDPRVYFTGWQFIFAIIIFFVVYGLVHEFNGKYGLYVKAIGIAAVVSLLLSIGVSSPFLSGAYYFLYENMPFFSGMRETQKFMAPLVLAYAYLGGIGVAYLGEGLARLKVKAKKILPIALAVLIFIIPLSYTYPMLFGLHGQLSNTDYPQDYYQVEALLNQDKDEFNILVLPWHNYMSFSWIGSNVSNPALGFFARPVIQGDNIEVAGIYTQSTNPVSTYVEDILNKRKEISNVGEFLSPLGVKYVILAKEVDWTEYAFLEQQADLAIVSDTPHLRLFINRSYTEITPPIRNKANLLGLPDKITENLVANLTLYEQKRYAWVGYLISFLLLLGGAGYVLRRVR